MRKTNNLTTTPRKRASAWAAVLLVVLLPVVASASTVVRTGERISIAEDEVVQGDLYTAAGSFSHSGRVEGDELAVAGSYTNNGEVDGDVLVLGGSVQHHASVTDDVRIIGGDVTISQSVGGDVFVIGGALSILSSATIAGDVTFFGGNAEINGTVGGDVMGMSDRIRVDGPVAGNVDVTTNQLTLGERAEITGNVRYVSAQEVERSQSAVVEGEIDRNEVAPTAEPAFDTSDLLVRFFVSVFAALVLYLFLKQPLQRMAARVVKQPAMSVLVGLSVMIMSPVVAVVLIVTVLGLLLGLSVFASVIALYVVGAALTPVLVGGYLSQLVGKRVQVDVLWIVVGALVLQLLALIPFIGILLVTMLLAMSIGGLLLQIYHQLRT